MKVTIKRVTLCLVVLLCGFVSNNVLAAESNGGQVSSTSKITFYQVEEPKKDEPTPDPKPTPTPKPSLPQTGEVLRNYSLIGLGVISLTAGLFYLLKRRKGYEK